jgi:hypothetical protein
MFINDAISLWENYGWAALFLFFVSIILFKYLSNFIPTWNKRDVDRLDKQIEDSHDKLRNHQFFNNLKFTLYNEIPTLKMDSTPPVRQKMLRKLLESKLVSIQETVEIIVEHDTHKLSSQEWAAYVISEIHKCDEILEAHAIHAGVPSIVISKFMIWQMKTIDVLINYVNDLAVSTVYSTNTARLNTLLYLLSLQLSTIVGDAEKTLQDLNGELSGLPFAGEILE